MSELSIAFKPNGVTVPVGGLGIGSIAGMGAFAGPVPEAADIAWTDPAGKRRSAHVQITPLPPPTRTSHMGSDRQIYFVINADGSVAVFGHCPGLRD